MEHVFFILYSLASTLGIIVLIFLAIFLNRSGDTLLQKYFIFMLLVFALFLTEVIEIYGYVSGLEFLRPASLFSIAIYKILEIAIFSYIPLFVFQLLSRRQPSLLFCLCLGGGVVLSVYTAYSLYSGNNQILDTLEILFTLWTIFWVFLLLYESRKHYSVSLKKTVFILGILVLLFCPFLLIDILSPPAVQFIIHPHLNSISIPFLVFFILWNCLNLFLGIRYYSKRASKYTDNLVPPAFLKQYAITERETEIILQVMRGLSNKEIAYYLSISSKTVKNHIYNIYQKTRVQSRIELLIQVVNYNPVVFNRQRSKE